MATPIITNTKEQVLANIQRMKDAGWVNEPPPVQLPSGNWALQGVRVTTYGLKPNIDRHFISEEAALEFLTKAKAKYFNIYRSIGESVGGSHWRTDF